MNSMPCYCPAYPFPHRPGGGKCQATGEVQCPNCCVVLDDEQVRWVLWARETRYCPAEYIPVFRERCGHCGAQGVAI